MKYFVKTKNYPSADECMNCPVFSGLRDESLCLKCYSKSLVYKKLEDNR